MSVVVDCSVAINWVIPDEGSLYAESILERVSVGSGVVPPLFRIEVGNSLLVAWRRKRITAELLGQALARIDALPLKQDTLGAAYVWSESIVLAQTYGLSLYDATYLELAKRLGLPLATLDTRLAQAARSAGVHAPWPNA